MIYILLISVSFLLWFSYMINNKDIISPSVLLCAAYFVSVVSAIYNIEAWNIDFQFNTYTVIMTGLTAFVLTEWIVNTGSQKKYSIANKLKTTERTSNSIHIQNCKTILVILFDIVVLYLYFKEVYRISLLGGNTGGIATMMTFYRNIHSYSINLLPGEDISTIVTQLANVVAVLGYVYLFVLIHNTVYVKDKLSRNLKYVLPVMLYVVLTFINAARINLIYVVAAALVLSYVMLQRRTGWQVRLNFKYIKIGLICMFAIFITFSFSRGLVGRLSEASTIDYVTSYAGGSVQLFNSYLQNPPISDGHFGSETFIGLQKLFYKMGLSDYQRLVHLEFRTSGSLLGNTYTALRRYYQDFGLFGMVVCQMILAFIYIKFYNKLKMQTMYNSSSNYWLIVYLMIIPGIMLHSVTDILYAEILSMGWLIKFFLLRVVYWFVVDVRIN